MNPSEIQGTTEPSSYLNFETECLAPYEEQISYFNNPESTTNHYDETTWGTNLSGRSLKICSTTTRLQQHRYTPYHVKRPLQTPYASNYGRSSYEPHSIFDTLNTINTEQRESVSINDLYSSISSENPKDPIEAMIADYMVNDNDDTSHNLVIATNDTIDTNTITPDVTDNAPNILSQSHRSSDTSSEAQVNIDASHNLVDGTIDTDTAITDVTTDNAPSVLSQSHRSSDTLSEAQVNIDASHNLVDDTIDTDTAITDVTTDNAPSVLSQSHRSSNTLPEVQSATRLHCRIILDKLFVRLWMRIAKQFMSEAEIEAISTMKNKTEGVATTYQQMDAVITQLLTKFKTLEDIIDVLERTKNVSTAPQKRNINSCIDDLTKLKNSGTPNATTKSVVTTNQVTLNHHVKKMNSRDQLTARLQKQRYALYHRSSDTLSEDQADIKLRCRLILEKLFVRSWYRIATQFMSQEEIEAISTITSETDSFTNYRQMNEVRTQLSSYGTRFKTLDEIIEVLEKAKNVSTKPQKRNLHSCIKDLITLKNSKTPYATI